MKALNVFMARVTTTQQLRRVSFRPYRHRTSPGSARLLRPGHAVLFALLGLTISTTAQSVSFNPPVSYGAGSSPVAVAVGDFNGDGRSDLAVANDSDNNLSVLVGNGDGTFQTAVNYPAGSGGRSIETGDFNRDGKLDLTVGKPSNAVRVMLGNGDGTFQGPVNQATGLNPTTVLVGDFNRDGNPDILSATGGNYSVLVGNGDGTFQGSASHAFSSSPFFAATFSDFNCDGKLDLALAVNTGLLVLLGNGDATFQGEVPFVGAMTYAVAAGDFSNDGKPDLISGHNGSVSFRLGNGDGTFQPPSTFPAGNYVTDLTAADVNDDGKLDIVTTGIFQFNNVDVLLGNGNGTFQAKISIDNRVGATSVSVGDFNRDGKPDIAAIVDGYADVLLNTTVVPAGFFGSAIDIPVNSHTVSIAGGDFNCDGNLDLVAANTGNNFNVSVVLGNGDGTFLNVVQYAAGASNPESVAVGDLNRDGNPDIIVGKGFNYVSVLLGNGNGTFSAAVDYLSFGGRDVTVADFNRDGKLDVAAANTGISGDSHTITVLLGNGDGTLQSLISTAVGETPFSLVHGDFNRDGKVDLAVASVNDDTLSILLGNGNGTFQSPINYPVSFLRFVCAGDVNRDGKLDLVFGSLTTVRMMLGNGDGTFLPAVNSGSGVNPSSAALEDINLDGKLDLIVSNAGPNNVSTLLGNGDGTFQSALNYPLAAGAVPRTVMAGDLNHDGKPDLVAANTNGNSLSKLINRGTLPANISGHLLYANGVTPAKNVTVTLAGPAGSTPRTTTTDANGNYSFASVPTGDDYTITLSKTGDVNGIESLDASNVARYVAGLDIPTANQRIAADADGDGILTSLDAALIARRVAGLPGFGIVGTWKFVPVSRTYTALGADQTGQNFTAILVGDTSGNWLPAIPSLVQTPVRKRVN
jgi:hypothetical protein